MTTTVTVTKPTDDERRTQCRILIGVMLAHADPELRRISVLASQLDITRQHLNGMIRAGRCSPSVARAMQKKFGRVMAPFEELYWNRTV